MLSKTQLEKWVSSKTFLDMDCSFISPLESAATLGVLKVFSVFKPSPSNFAFFEIEHFDRKFSGMKLPRVQETL